MSQVGSSVYTDIFKQAMEINNPILTMDAPNKRLDGTSIPYATTNLPADIVINPCTVSIYDFRKMAQTQPVLSNGITTLTNLVMGRIDHYAHTNPKYQDFIQEMLRNLKTPWQKVLQNMLVGLIAGFSIQEKESDFVGKHFMLLDLAPRPPESILFRVDSQGNIKEDGIIQYYYNTLWNIYNNFMSANTSTPGGCYEPNPYSELGDFPFPFRATWAQPWGSVFIPRDKCVHWAYNGVGAEASPYGLSILRACYDTYLQKTEMARILANAANIKSSPIPILTIDPNQTSLQDGQTAFDNMREALTRVNYDGRGDGFILAQMSKEALGYQSIQSTANLEEMLQINEYLDRMSLTGILFASELAGLSDKGSYALGKTQQDLLGRTIGQIAKSLNDTLIHQVVKPYLQINFNEQTDFGQFVESEDVAEDVAVGLDVITALSNNGVELRLETMMRLVGLNENDVKKYEPIDRNDPANGNTQTLWNTNNAMTRAKSILR